MAERQQWAEQRRQAYQKIAEKAAQKTINKIADATARNAASAARIKEKLLRQLEKEIDALPDIIGTETRQSVIEKTPQKGGGSRIKDMTKTYKLRDLAATYRDITADMPKMGDDTDDPVTALLRRWDDAATGQ